MEPASTRQLQRAGPVVVPPVVRTGPPPLHGGPLTFLRFARQHHMLRPGYAVLIARWVWVAGATIADAPSDPGDAVQNCP